MQSVERETGRKLSLVYQFHANRGESLEVYLHYHLREHRMHGEWFKLSPEDVQRIPELVKSMPAAMCNDSRPRNAVYVCIGGTVVPVCRSCGMRLRKLGFAVAISNRGRKTKAGSTPPAP